MILPLAEPQLAERHAVAPPKAIVLFGPPGTGKTTFAKGIASRLGWPFVELQPARLGGQGPSARPSGSSSLRCAARAAVGVAFIDEVEDIASMRQEDRRVSPSLTNELLRQIPRIRDSREHLLVCATNWVARLDTAFLRPGRFDYVLAVGPPDAEARAAIWQRYVGRDHRRGRRRRGARRGHGPLHPGRHRVRRPQGRAARLRARALRAPGPARDHRRLPRRDPPDAAHARRRRSSTASRRTRPSLPASERQRAKSEKRAKAFPPRCR